MVVLDAIEQRVLGSLIEKELTTPDYYPLTLNALTAACNQKSNREPVMQLDEAQVRGGMDGLISKDFGWQRFAPGSRVAKYAHKFSDTLSKVIEFNKIELAIVAELLLRGPQTPGELRTHGMRMVPIASVEEVDRVLRHLASRQDGPFVVELPRAPGQREARFVHLFGGQVQIDLVAEAGGRDVSRSSSSSVDARLLELERAVEELRLEVSALKAARSDHPS